MAMNSKAALLVLTLSVGGCTLQDPGFGDSVRTNIAIQTVDPDVAYDGVDATFSGETGAAAVQRYRTDKVKPLKGIRVTSGGTGGAGVSSSSGR